ncbi:hypothetical protein AB5I41_01525 [Sphingomonas sp. MMS24-JH45]
MKVAVLGEDAGPNAVPGETIVEHPLSPTDSNPNPHGQRDEGIVSVATKDADGNVQTSKPEDGDTEIEGLSDEPVHLGDGAHPRQGPEGQSEQGRRQAASRQQAGEVMERLLDHNPETGLKIVVSSSEEDGGTWNLRYEQDVSPVSDRNKAAQADSWDRREEMWHAAHIPAVVLMEWKNKHGVEA